MFTGPAAPEVIGGQLPELHVAYETFAAAFKKCVEEGDAQRLIDLEVDNAIQSLGPAHP